MTDFFNTSEEARGKLHVCNVCADWTWADTALCMGCTELMKYKITVVNDQGTPFEVIREYKYDSAVEAVTAWNKCVDHGFAAKFSEVTLREPNGKTHTKKFFVGQVYR